MALEEKSTIVKEEIAVIRAWVEVLAASCHFMLLESGDQSLQFVVELVDFVFLL